VRRRVRFTMKTPNRPPSVFHALTDGTDKGGGRSVNDNVCDDVCDKVWSGEEKWHTIPHSSTVRVAVLVNRFFRLSVNENGDANG